MKITYDPRYNIAYIYFREKNMQIETVQISDEMNVDLAPDGTIYGIELLNANQQLSFEGENQLVFINEAVGKSIEIALNSCQVMNENHYQKP